MAINKTVTLTWDGKEYPILMTMRNIDRIEEDINLMRFTQQCMSGDMRMSHACKFISIVLGFGGLRISARCYTHRYANTWFLLSSNWSKKNRFKEEEIQNLVDEYPWGSFYQALVGEWGIAPSEYWNMTPSEVSLILEAKRPKHVGGLHEDDFYELEEKRMKMEAEGKVML